MCQSQCGRELETNLRRGQTRHLTWPSNSDLAIERQGCVVAQAGEVCASAGENNAATRVLTKVWMIDPLLEHAQHFIQTRLNNPNNE